MPKIKTSKAILKRFRITKSCKILRKQSGKSHLLEKKNSNRKRHLRKIVFVNDRDLKNLLHQLPYV